MSRTRCLPLAAALGVFVSSGLASAQTQIRPRILVLMDTSGSMLFDLNNIPCNTSVDCPVGQGCPAGGGFCVANTLGDGSSDGPWGAGWNMGYPGIDVDADAQPNDSRLFLAKSVLNDIFNSTGDIDFAFERYHGDEDTPFGFSCPQVTPAYANNLGAAATDINGNFGCVVGPLRFDPFSYQGFGIRDNDGVCAPGLDPGGDVLVDFSNDNQNELLSWIDGQEDFLANRFDWVDPVFSHELRASGFTPLARSIQTARTYVEPFLDAEPLDASFNVCRPYYVVIVTDGEDTCESCGCREPGTICTLNSQCCTGTCQPQGGGNPARCASPPAGQSYACTNTSRQTVPVDRVEELCEVNGGTAYDINECAIKSYVIGLALNSTTLDNMADAGSTGFGAFVATNRDELAEAFSEIIEGSILVEVCDGADNDCDTLVDEGFPLFCNRPGAHNAQDLCVDPGETACNSQDDNCNGQIDEGFPKYCNRPGNHNAQDLCVDPGETICDGVDDNCNGIIDEGVCTCINPSAEICDGLDNDCDGQTDEGLTRVCGTDLGECGAGVETCVGGAFGGCTATGPFAEICDGLDNNCDGQIDGVIQACGTDEGECVAGTQLCVAGNFGACVGGVGPRAESCDGLDNDCDGSTDEGLGGGACGNDIGECDSGTYSCLNGSLVCVGGDDGGPELCDTLDNDCDGQQDEGNPEGGAACGPATDEGACERGSLVCVDGDLVCQGGTFPGEEVCDGEDNDCDGETDENNPGGGVPCGDETGECVGGTTLCRDGELICDGETPGTPEECNGLDDDCDGAIDEGLGIGGPCDFEEIGLCEPGTIICLDGEAVCDGGQGPVDEVCDGFDNDCDGSIDEGLGLGEACGKEVGLCEPGRLQCVEGVPLCTGGVPANEERCDCEDNDCDSLVDENPDEICPPGSRCIDCGCALPCGPDPEFPCPPGDHCIEGYCIGDLCAGVHCPGASRCDHGECVSPCDLITCDQGTRCDINGLCQVDDCYNFPDDCEDGQACIDAECQVHPCDGVTCEGTDYCRSGNCVGTCVGVTCDAGQHCVDGACAVDPCAGVECRGERRFCDPTTGECADDNCFEVTCAEGFVCERTTGDCVEDPCNVTTCAAGDVCIGGICAPPGYEEPDGGEEVVGKRVLATGGGGCNCTTAGTGGNGGQGVGLLGLLGILGMVWRQSRGRRNRGVGLAALGVLAVPVVLGTGCTVDPYCIDCPSPGSEDGGDDTDGGPVPDGSVIPTPDGGPLPDGGVTDGGGDPDGCAPDSPELCNGVDDDCDGDIDEGIDFTSPAHCGNCETVCLLAHAFPTCTWSGTEGQAGTCGIDRCDVGFVDLDEEVGDGCEYTCLAKAEDDVICDDRDDDCDGDTDEDVVFLTDPENCGECGERCTYLHGSGVCEDGACRLDDCEDGFFDDNDDPADGCEYQCGPAEAETCDGRDNDCDGVVDNGDPGGGGNCGIEEGLCQPGTNACVGGLVICQGGAGPDTEVCDGEDNDCDGETDETDPDEGTGCGDSTGDCVAGVLTCNNGDLICVGAVESELEVCDGRDNDCDGVADNGNPGGGAACGTDTGECVAGIETCTGGVISCGGTTGPALDVCNGLDDDCDGVTDQDFDLDNSIYNCGACNTQCSYANAVGICATGNCQMAGCLPDYYDRNNNDADGCEAGPCVLNGNEICNGRDDDCDGSTDEGLAAPANFCNANGVCAGSTASCQGNQGWVCNYPGTYQAGGETLCDNRDNDCDGLVDEPFPGKGGACDNGGIGACRRTGTNVCNVAQNGIRCNAPAPGAGTPETCNGLDDDCDGSTDEAITLANMNAVHITSSNPDYWIFQYEASRPDAALASAGQNDDRACSRRDVLPWTDVTEADAEAACCALNAGGTCSGAVNEWRLCDAATWEDACRTDNNFTYPYGNAYGTNTCNGNDWDSNLAQGGDQDSLYATRAFAGCISDWGAAGQIFDMSGNVKEWTSTQRPGVNANDPYEIRGGAYNNAPGGLTCGFDFTLASEDFNFQNIGFRCCYYE